MITRLRHIIVTFLIVTLAWLGSARAGVRDCSADCLLCAVPAAVSCCDVLSVDHGDMVSAKPTAKSSVADCPHGQLCATKNNPVDVVINSTFLVVDVVLPASVAVFHERFRFTYLQPDSVPRPPPEDVIPHYIRNCSYLI